MKIQDKAYVALEYRLSLGSGTVLDRTNPDNPIGFIFNSGQILPGLEKKIEGMEQGQRAQVVLTPEEGYGQKRPELIKVIERSRFPKGEDIKPGHTYSSPSSEHNVRFQVVSVEKDSVTVDFNHPLAGETLHFDVTVSEVRPASEEELEKA